MCALGRLLSASEFEADSLEAPFSVEELQRAIDLREHQPAWNVRRRDHCPHPAPCSSSKECIEAIAWYLRHRREIEQQLTDAGLQPI